MLTTLCLTVFVDLISAVAMGLIVAGLANAGQLENLELDSVVSVPLLDQMFLYEGEEVEGADPFEARVGMVALRGSFTVASSRKLVWTISLDIKDSRGRHLRFLGRHLHRRQRRHGHQETHRRRHR